MANEPQRPDPNLTPVEATDFVNDAVARGALGATAEYTHEGESDTVAAGDDVTD